MRTEESHCTFSEAGAVGKEKKKAVLGRALTICHAQGAAGVLAALFPRTVTEQLLRAGPGRGAPLCSDDGRLVRPCSQRALSLVGETRRLTHESVSCRPVPDHSTCNKSPHLWICLSLSPHSTGSSSKGERNGNQHSVLVLGSRSHLTVTSSPQRPAEIFTVDFCYPLCR